jgi:hypothetical protein
MMAGRIYRKKLCQGGAALVILLGCAVNSSMAGETGSWTNRAGHVLKASPQTLKGQTVTFVQDGNGKTVEYPLSGFSQPDQERLRRSLGDTALPEGLKSAYEFSGRVLKRSRLLYENGQMSEEDYRKSLAATLSAFRAQAAPLIEQHKLSQDRLDLILREMAAATE